MYGKEGTGVLVAAHRGRFGGDIPENTVRSYLAAVCCGADIVEGDVARTKDGVLVMLHDFTVDRVTNGSGLISELTFEEIRRLRFREQTGEVSDYHVDTLEEALECLKGRCYLNLDRCWNFFDPVFELVKRHGMEEQVLFKSPYPIRKSAEWLAKWDYEPNLMPIMRVCEDIPFDRLKEFTKLPPSADPNLRAMAADAVSTMKLFAGIRTEEEIEALLALSERAKIPSAELIVPGEESIFLKRELMDRLHGAGIKVWINSLSIAMQDNGGHNDTVSVLGHPEDGWGWLIDKGADILQTDWCMELKAYLKQKK